jgi:N-acetylglutamate synthase-like GNAT family acetyltransferase
MVRIRLAGEADAGLITDLRCAFLDELGQTLEDGFADHLRSWVEDTLQDHRLLVWLAEIDGRVAGCAAVNPYPHMPSAQFPRGVGWYLLNVYVKPAHRKAGVAGALLASVGASAREQEVDELSLHSTATAHALYERFGFRASVDAMSMPLA